MPIIAKDPLGLQGLKGLGRFFGFGGDSDIEAQLSTLAGRFGGTGERAETEFLRRISGYDAGAALEKSTGALFEGFSEDLANQLLSFEGRRAGNVRSGFTGAGARQQVLNPLFDRFSRQVASQALSAEQLNLGALQSLGDYGVSRTGQQLDILTGQLEREQQDKASRRGLLGSLLKTGGTIAGAALLFSDEDLKENIHEREDPLKRLAAVKSVDWDWNEEGRAVTGKSGGDSGVLAGDVERTMPEHVVRDEATGRRKVNYGHPNSGLVGELVSGVNELGARLADIEKRLGKAA